jgi:hypothetical protein
MKMVRRVPRSGSGKRREWERCGAEGQHQRVPAMGRGTCLAKRRILGQGAGGEDEDTLAEMVSSGAAHHAMVAGWWDEIDGEMTRAATEVRRWMAGRHGLE